MTALTLCPGNVLYMAPEALDEAKSYTAKLDVFSFGVIVIQILTRQFPAPTSRFQYLQVPGVDGDVRLLVPDKERRKAQLNLIPDTNTLKPLAIQCLNKKDSERPSALELSERLSELKQTSLYTESMSQAQNKNGSQLQEQLQQYQKQIEEMASEREELQQAMYHALDAKQRELEQTEKRLQASERLVSEFQQCLQQKDKTITDLQQTIRTHERKIQQLEQQNAASRGHPGEESVTIPQPTVAAAEEEDGGKMRWRKGTDAPQVMWRGAAVVHGNTAYFTTYQSHKVYSYQNILGSEQWSQLLDNPCLNFGLAVIDGLLTSVGGSLGNTLCSLTGRGERKGWYSILPPMPTSRNCVTCITTKKALVVAGGVTGVFSRSSNIVEVMNINTKQWSAVAPLPQKCNSPSATICGDSLFLVDGNLPNCSKSVFTCSLPDLISSNYQSHNVWREISSLPVKVSTLASFGGDLLAIGGFDDSATTTSNVFKYDSNTDTWNVTSQMKEKRYHCLAVTLPGEILVVVGGGIRGLLQDKGTQIVELLM